MERHALVALCVEAFVQSKRVDHPVSHAGSCADLKPASYALKFGEIFFDVVTRKGLELENIIFAFKTPSFLLRFEGQAFF